MAEGKCGGIEDEDLTGAVSLPHLRGGIEVEEKELLTDMTLKIRDLSRRICSILDKVRDDELDTSPLAGAGMIVTGILMLNHAASSLGIKDSRDSMIKMAVIIGKHICDKDTQAEKPN
jgi:hypothetical protein